MTSPDPAVEALIADGTWSALPLGPSTSPRTHRSRVAEGLVRLVREADAAEPVRATDPVRAALREAAEWLWQCHDALMRGEDDPGIGDAWNALRAALAADREPEPVQVTDEMARKVLVQLLMRSPNGLTEASVKEALAAALSDPPPEGESE